MFFGELFRYILFSLSDVALTIQLGQDIGGIYES
jgi:hypothetical protein